MERFFTEIKTIKLKFFNINTGSVSLLFSRVAIAADLKNCGKAIDQNKIFPNKDNHGFPSLLVLFFNLCFFHLRD